MAGNYSKNYFKNEDFEEGEVWGTIEDNKNELINSSPKLRTPIKNSPFFPTPSFTTPKMIPKLPTSEIITNGKNLKQSSAPLDIPNWSKIYGKKVSKKKNISNNYNNNASTYDHYSDGEDGNEDDIDGMMPPHEYIARKLARNEISSFSVYEGVGRTLKGRDLSKVRNTILSRTGFLE